MYLWLIAFHLITVVCWFAALFYLPRLCIYHSLSDDQISIERFELMERNLFYLVANPAVIGTVILGTWIFLLAPQTYLGQNWFLVKIILVVLLIGYHLICLAYMKNLTKNHKFKSHKFLKVFNEIPALFLFGIVILAVIKPF
tara:strand:- start:34 stop:459 length:426 start_codon:yes stop_codon:yes gene_type:complete